MEAEREKDAEKRRWSDIVAAESVNYNTLMARRAQELVNVKYDLAEVRQAVAASAIVEKEKYVALMNKSEAALKDVIKDIFIHVQNGPEAALQLKTDSGSYLTESEQRQLKKMKKEREEKFEKFGKKKGSGFQPQMSFNPQLGMQQQVGSQPFLSSAMANVNGWKANTTCAKCGMRGHWHKDLNCPYNQQMAYLYANQTAATQPNHQQPPPPLQQGQFPAIQYTKP